MFKAHAYMNVYVSNYACVDANVYVCVLVHGPVSVLCLCVGFMCYAHVYIYVSVCAYVYVYAYVYVCVSVHASSYV